MILATGPAGLSCLDNGNPYRSKAHAIACRELAIGHLRTKPYTPRTNGKAERFIKTMLDGWAYDAIYGSSRERARALPAWLDRYNRKRPHRLDWEDAADGAARSAKCQQGRWCPQLVGRAAGLLHVGEPGRLRVAVHVEEAG